MKNKQNTIMISSYGVAGPREENLGTKGGRVSSHSLLVCIFTYIFLQFVKKKKETEC